MFENPGEKDAKIQVLVVNDRHQPSPGLSPESASKEKCIVDCIYNFSKSGLYVTEMDSTEDFKFLLANVDTC